MHQYSSQMDSLSRLCADLNASKASSVEQGQNWIIAIVYFAMAIFVGFTYIASLRHQVQLNASRHGSIVHDKRLSMYVYALPVLAYVLLESLALARRLAQYKCDLCMLGLVSGMVIAICKPPSTRGVKLVVWSSQQQHLVWIKSPRETLAQVQEEVARVLGVQPASRVCFNTQTANEYASDLSQPLSSLAPAVAAPAPPRDFFGLVVVNLHVSVQSLDALHDANRAQVRGRDSKGQAQAQVSKRQQLIKSFSGIFGSKRGAPATSGTTTTTPSATSPAATNTPQHGETQGSEPHAQTPLTHLTHFADRISLGNRLLDERLEGAIDESETDVQRSSRADAAAAAAASKTESDSSLTPRRYAWSRLSIKGAFSGKKDRAAQGGASGSTPSSTPRGSPTHQQQQRFGRSSLGAASFDESGSGKWSTQSHVSDANSTTTGEAPASTAAAAEETSLAPLPPPPRTVLFAVPKPRREQVDAYVDAIINDPAMNIAGIPDKFERKIYTLAISMALQQCLKLLFSCNGKAVLGHHVELELRPGRMPTLPPNPKLEYHAVTRLVDELLREKMINLTWLHDSIEGPLYVNVILSILTVMHSFFAATKFDLLGHSVSMQLTPLPLQDTMAGIKTRLKARCVDEVIIEEQLDLHFLKAPKNWLPDSLERPIFKTLYALVLCATEEVFKDMRIGFLGDTCILHLVAGPMPPPPPGVEVDASHKAQTASGAAAHPEQLQEQHGTHELMLAALCGAIVSNFLFR